MTLPKNYSPAQSEPALQQEWQDRGTYHFDPTSHRQVYSIDTPPPTVSGHLHLGHVYSYSQADFIARFQRMRGRNVFYPMGYDDNGLPTDRLVEKLKGVSARQVGKQAFAELCLRVSAETEQEYRALFLRLGLSVDWRYTYRTIDAESQRISQLSFLQLYHQERVYRQSAPAIWCPECRVSIAQADLNDLERDSEFITLPFSLPDGQMLPVATTRPELLAACVAIFVHPDDARYQVWIGQSARVPIYDQVVPILADPAADPQKGTGAVMCCTFGDQTDVAWWFTHKLALIESIEPDGRMTAATGELCGLSPDQARRKIKEILAKHGLILSRQPTRQSIRVHERCDTPVEYRMAEQWFIRILDQKAELLRAGAQIHWHPEHMQSRYSAWVENLNWDWCISRQRNFGVPFPVWYCASCGQVNLPDESELPVNPLNHQPSRPCACGSTRFAPETDTLDTWATSSLSPQICGQWLSDPMLYQKVYPFSLRPQAHEIIRTWAFYTIFKSHNHFGQLPWSDTLISGWALAGEGMGKISKSHGGGSLTPQTVIEKTSADAVRYWAASTSPGKDTLISEEKIQMGTRLVTKLWNVARFSEKFLTELNSTTLASPTSSIHFSSADRWILARLQQVVRRCTSAFEDYEYASAKAEAEAFFWRDLADNYLEMAKQRLYNPEHPQHTGAVYAMRSVLLSTLKLFAPFLPYITETLFQSLFAEAEVCTSIHTSSWPQTDPTFEDISALELGETLVSAASAVRRYKSEQNLSLGTEFSRLQLIPATPQIDAALHDAAADLASITRAQVIEIVPALAPHALSLVCESEEIKIGIVIQ